MASASKLEALLAMGKLIAPGSKSLPVEVTLAFADPSAYTKRFAKRLKARGITKAPKHLPWIALIDALDEAGALAEIDHRADTDDVKAAIDGLFGLRASKHRWKWLNDFSEEELEDRDLAEVLERVGSHLASEAVVLAQLDMDSDAYPVIVVPKKDSKRLVALGKAAGYGQVTLFTGSNLAKLERDRAKREAKRQAFVGPPANDWRVFMREQGGQTLAWSILISGDEVEHESCVLGRPLSSTTDTFDSSEAAAKAGARLMAERKAEGYREIPLAEFRALDAAETQRLATQSKRKATKGQKQHR